MVGEIFAGLGAVKTAYDMAKGLQGMHDAALRDKAVIELQKLILSIQEEQFSLTARNRNLEKEIGDLKSWEAEKERYELVEIAPNTVAFAQKKGVERPEPRHYLCANCFSVGKKSYLQQTVRGDRLDRYKCNSCGEELTIHKDGPPRQASVNRGPGGPHSWMNR